MLSRTVGTLGPDRHIAVHSVGIAVALMEIAMGVIGGSVMTLEITPWVTFLAGFGAVVLTFLAGAEIDPDSLKENLAESVGIGFLSFLLPFVAGMAAAYYWLGWGRERREDCRDCLVHNLCGGRIRCDGGKRSFFHPLGTGDFGRLFCNRPRHSAGAWVVVYRVFAESRRVLPPC